MFTDHGEACGVRGRVGDYAREGRLEGLEEASHIGPECQAKEQTLA